MAAQPLQVDAPLDEPLAVVTFGELEAVDHSMTSPAPIAALVQRRGLYEHDSV